MVKTCSVNCFVKMICMCKQLFHMSFLTSVIFCARANIFLMNCLFLVQHTGVKVILFHLNKTSINFVIMNFMSCGIYFFY